MKKVLIITYYWPPAGGPGVQRWLKFVKYLPQFNIRPIVYIPENPNYPILDKTFVNEIPEGVTMYRHPIREPYKIAALFTKKATKRISSGIIKSKNQSFLERCLLWVRGNFFIPDARKYWVRPSVKFLEPIIEKENIDTIITTGPPHSVHLIGYELRQAGTINWLADFRDPWTTIGYHKKLKLSVHSQKRHKQLEHMVLNTADKVIVTSYTTKEEFQAITPKPIAVITNGYDMAPEDEPMLTDEFTISHIGSLLTGRNPEVLWKVLAQLIRDNKDFKKAFKLRLAGVVSEDVFAGICDFGLKEYTQLLGYVTHEEALRLQRESQILLLVEIDSADTVGILPGKLYEYMSAKRPVLAIGPKNWDANRIISETNIGVALDYNSESELKDVILEWFALYKKGNLNTPRNAIAKYSRRELTGKLAKLI